MVGLCRLAAQLRPLGFIIMAGPCIDIYTRQPISSSDELLVRNLIRSISNSVNDDDFWIANQPFLVTFGEPEPEVRELIIDGWSPRGAVSYCAMCNAICDHVLLAMLCHRTAQLLDGLIHLGNISTITADPSVLTFDGARPTDGYGYIVRPAFLGYWLSHPEFRLLK